MSIIGNRRRLAGSTALAVLIGTTVCTGASVAYAGIGTEKSGAATVLVRLAQSTNTSASDPQPVPSADSADAPSLVQSDDAEEQPAAAEDAGEPEAAEADAPAQPETAETPAESAAEEPAQAEAAPEPEAPAAAEAEPAAEAPEAETAEAPAAEPAESVPDTAPAVEVAAPSDPKDLVVFQILEKHCARCHQDGKLVNRLRPAKNFGDVLDLKRIALDPNLIQPGNPDASRIYKQIVKKEMPYDTYYEFSGAEPTEAEVAALRDWIEGLGQSQTASCEAHKFVTNEDLVGAIAADLQSEPDHRVKGMRYFTLTNIANACAGEEELEVYRQGFVKLLNSLSRNPDVVRLNTVDEAKTIIKVNLEDLNWTSEDWEKLVSAYPYAIDPDVKLNEFIKQATDTNLAYIRADWMAFAASRPPLYHTILKLPTSFDGLQKELKLDIKSNLEKFLAKRAGFQVSGVSRNNRLIERHGIETGAFWTSYDFAGNKDKQNLLEHPLGPDGENAFTHDGGETIFSLPNGFNGYYLNTAKGDQLNTGPTNIVQDTTQKDLAVTNGISCFGCHDQGFRKAKDDIRAHVENDRTFSKEVRDAVTALYPTHEEMDVVIENDVKSFRAAMEKAGLNPDLKYGGIEMINALSKQYEKDVNLKLAAAEFGLSDEEFVSRLEGAGGEAFRIKRRLEQGVIPRDTFEVGFKNLLVKVTDDKVAEAKGVDATAVAEVATVADVKEKADLSRDFEIALFSDKSKYKKGDLATFTVSSKQDCNLTLINVDSKGVGTVLLPNDFQKENFLKAGTEIQVPGADAAFQLRLQDKGTETVIAVCNASQEEVDGIKHNFDEKQFTELGNYRSFAVRAIKVEKTKKGKKASEEAAETGKITAKGDVLARTAIKFEVK
ncbi:MAG: DUF4384 domain-containing protein [Hyphomicrobiaceae bacterium]